MKNSVKNQFEETIGCLSKRADVNLGAIIEYQLMSKINEPIAPKTAHRKHSYKTNKRNNLIRHAKELGFSLKEIKKFLVFWNMPLTGRTST